jgi:hypothetical protein
MKIITMEQHRAALNTIDRTYNVFNCNKPLYDDMTFEQAFSNLEKTIKKSVEFFVHDTLAGADATEALGIMDDARDALVDLHNHFHKPNFVILEHKNTPLSQNAKQLQEAYATMKAARAAKLQTLVNNMHIGHNMV